jgi:hypothetical protein
MRSHSGTRISATVFFPLAGFLYQFQLGFSDPNMKEIGFELANGFQDSRKV